MATAYAPADDVDLLLARLEEQYEAQTERLGRLLARRRSRRTAVPDAAEITAEITECRASLARTARTLARLAEPDFASCTGCAGDISLAELLRRPHERLCPGCAAAAPQAVPA